MSQADKLWEMLSEKANPKGMREILQTEPNLKEELLNRVLGHLGDIREEGEI